MTITTLMPIRVKQENDTKPVYFAGIPTKPCVPTELQMTQREQLCGTPGLCLMEQFLLVSSSDEIVKYSYMNTSSVELKGILPLPPTQMRFLFCYN